MRSEVGQRASVSSNTNTEPVTTAIRCCVMLRDANVANNYDQENKQYVGS